MGQRIHVQRESRVPRLPSERSLRSWAQAALANGAPVGELCLRVVDEDEMRTLNARYRGRDYATNVLSFPAELPAGAPVALLGDIVLCAPVVEREAREQGKPGRAHWAHLVVHGTLHLLGHDHEKPRDARRMESLEREILGSIGIPDPYEPR
jgi:probable rRNA maturation factor